MNESVPKTFMPIQTSDLHRVKAIIGHFGAGDDQAIRIRKFFDEIQLLRSVRPMRLLKPMRSKRLQGFKASKITIKDFRVIQFLEFSFVLMF